jgi:hypothetical protein
MIEERICNYIENGTDIISVGLREEITFLSKKKINNHHCFFSRNLNNDDNNNNHHVMVYNFALSNGIELFQRRDNVFYTAITLDSVRQTFDKNKVSFVTINDVESPLKVLQGSQLFLEKHRPTLFIQISDKELEKTQRFLNRINYVLLERVGDSNYLFYYM